MNDNDLERDLRSQHGPREAGYTPAVLPMALEDAPAGGATPSRLGRAGLFVGVGVAGALAVAVVAGILSGPGSGPEVGAGSESPSTAASTPAVGACAAADVAFSAEPWGGAAGSRGTTVSVSLAAGRYACTIDGAMTAQISDANGAFLISGSAVRFGPINGRPVELEPGMTFTSGIRWSNWCGTDPATPVQLSLGLNGWPSSAPVNISAGTDQVPPCNGAESPSSLSITWWELSL